jgi:hypothetical protein
MTRVCTQCNVDKPLDSYEVTTKDGRCRRAVCKPCYAQLKKQRAKAGAADQSSIAKPTACCKCGRGPPEVDFKWRTDVKRGAWRTECNTCYNAKGYSTDYRARQRELDEAAYLERNARTHLAWVQKNPDKVKEQQLKTATIAERKIKTIKTSATQRDIEFLDADTAAMQEKLSSRCHFCDFQPSEGEALNGLDRVDPALGYTDANTVPCCAACNAMKGSMHVDEFVTNVRTIVAHMGCACECNDVARCRLKPFAGTTERREADAVDKNMDGLEEDLKVRLWSEPCYLCGRTPAFGIDRVDPRQGYVPDNVQPCCSTYCNYMKKDMALEDFKQHVGYIHAHTKDWVIGDVHELPLSAISGEERRPVAAVDASGNAFVFPSVLTAAMRTRGTAGGIRRALAGTGARYHGHAWRNATRGEYDRQAIDAASAMRWLMSLGALEEAF